MAAVSRSCDMCHCIHNCTACRQSPCSPSAGWHTERNEESSVVSRASISPSVVMKPACLWHGGFIVPLKPSGWSFLASMRRKHEHAKSSPQFPQVESRCYLPFAKRRGHAQDFGFRFSPENSVCSPKIEPAPDFINSLLASFDLPRKPWRLGKQLAPHAHCWMNFAVNGLQSCAPGPWPLRQFECIADCWCPRRRAGKSR